MASSFRAFLKRKDIEPSLQRYGIDAMSAMAQGLFCTLLVGTILNTLGSQFNIGLLTKAYFTIAGNSYTVGSLASAMAGPAMAVAIGYALKAPGTVLFSLPAVGYATNALGGAGGPFAVYIVAIIAAEFGKMVSRETRIDILVTPLVTLLSGTLVAALIAEPIGLAASRLGRLIIWATQQQPFLMGILVSTIVGMALTLPISSAAICAGLGLTGLAGGAALAGCCAQMVGNQLMSYRDNKCVALGLWTGWVEPSAAALANGATAITAGASDWLGLALVSIVLPAIICPLVAFPLRKAGWIKDGDCKLN